MLINHLTDIVAALVSGNESHELFAILAKAFQCEVGFRLLTITSIHAGNPSITRLWSSNIDLYPVGGIKKLGNSEWSRIVLQEHKPIVCNEPADLRRMFDDHEDIASLGCGAGVNLPVVLRGGVIGTVNIFHQSHWFSHDRIARASALLALVYTPMLLARQ